MGKISLSHDEFITILAEASQIVNNTPLWSISFDPDDPAPLSPAMLLTLRSQPSPITGEDYSEKDLLAYGKRRYRRSQYLSQQFCIRWKNENLSIFTKRHKWRVRKPCMRGGNVVLIRNKQAPRNHWRLGRVLKVNVSTDDLVRSVILRLAPSKGSTKPRSLVRPISELVLLVPHASHRCPFYPSCHSQDGGGVSSTST